MLGDTRDFNNIETRAVIKFSVSCKTRRRGKFTPFSQKIRGTCTIVCHRQNWVAQFKRGDFSTCDAPRPGRPKTVTTPEIIHQIHELILEDRRISAKSIAEQLGISRERVGSIIHEDLNTRKLSAKWVPKCLNADQKRQRCQSFRETFEIFFVVIQIISCRARLVTVGETWLYHYDPETKQQSVEWRHSGSPRHKHSEYKNPLEKFSPQFFGIKTASSSLIIFQRSKLSTITHFCWCN